MRVLVRKITDIHIKEVTDMLEKLVKQIPGREDSKGESLKKPWECLKSNKQLSVIDMKDF